MFKPNDRPGEARDLPKPTLKPAPYDPPLPATKPLGSGVRTGLPPQPASPKEPVAVSSSSEATPPATAASGGPAVEPGTSKLFIGVNIKLKGVEISDCDVLVIEGQVEATVHSKAMQIDQPGTLTGTALIDVAEIRGEFSGELTARTRLVVHGTGRVCGTIRYGKLIVEEGGELTGDVKRLESAEGQAQRSLLAGDARRVAPSGEPAPTSPNAGHHPSASRTYSS
jgi:cytoskeletal protein CcmA (bactofilin family)